MQKSPKGPKGPADAAGNAVKAMRSATAEEVEVDRDWNPAAILGVPGRASLRKKKRNEIAKKAAAKRWSAPS